MKKKNGAVTQQSRKWQAVLSKLIFGMCSVLITNHSSQSFAVSMFVCDDTGFQRNEQAEFEEVFLLCYHKNDGCRQIGLSTSVYH